MLGRLRVLGKDRGVRRVGDEECHIISRSHIVHALLDGISKSVDVFIVAGQQTVMKYPTTEHKFKGK
jgi:hypothetical protein